MILRSFYSILILLLLTEFTCAPYSLPEKKTYSEKDDPYTYYLESLEAYQAEEYTLALEKVNQALILNDNLAQFYQLKGNIYKRLFDYDQALLAYQSALRKRSNFTEVHESMGDIYQELVRYDEAVRAFKRVVVLDPSQISIILKIANCYILWDELDVAQHHLNNYENSAKDQKVGLSDNYFLLRGEVLFKMGKYEESIAFLRKMAAINKKAYHLLGNNYYALNDFENGVTYFNKLLNLEKDTGEWYLYRGIYYYHKHDYNDALGQFQIALGLDSNLVEVHYYLGKILLSEGKDTAALEEFRIYRQTMQKNGKLEEIEEILLRLENKN
jgi:tetratricopeptide (TPR) repeat protein